VNTSNFEVHASEKKGSTLVTVYQSHQCFALDLAWRTKRGGLSETDEARREDKARRIKRGGRLSEADYVTGGLVEADQARRMKPGGGLSEAAG
jgi:hypothetical protein